MTSTPIRLPNLSAHFALPILSANVETALEATRKLEVGQHCQLDLRGQSRISPWGVLTLLKICRVLREQTGAPIEVVNLSKDVYCYLQRAGLFTSGEVWLVCLQPAPTPWNSSYHSSNLLEITFVRGRDDVLEVVKHAEKIFRRWLGNEIDNLVCIFSELCTNIHKHSGDEFGCVMAQKYEVTTATHNYVRVCICVADLGIGIRGSLGQCHPDLPTQDSQCLLQAYDGLSARGALAKGNGLGLAAKFACESGGHLVLRSHTGRLEIKPNGTMTADDLVPFDGTQLAIEFQAPLLN